MNAVRFIAVWGIVAIVAAIVGGVAAHAKNRDHSWWAAWSFMFPPMAVLVLMMRPNTGPKPRRRSLDEEDASA